MSPRRCLSHVCRRACGRAQTRQLYADHRPWTQRKRRKGKPAAPRLDAEGNPKVDLRQYHVQVRLRTRGRIHHFLKGDIDVSAETELESSCTRGVERTVPLNPPATLSRSVRPHAVDTWRSMRDVAVCDRVFQ